MANAHDEELVGSDVVRRRLGGISDTTVTNHIKRGLLPEPKKIAGRNYWKKSAIDAIVEDCPAPDHSADGVPA